MKVYIGPYTNYISFNKMLSFLSYFKVSEDQIDLLADYLSETRLQSIIKWLNNKKKRKIKVKIDNYDCWDFKTSLSPIILPMLYKLKETKDGAPYVSDDDVPDELKADETTKSSVSNVDEKWFQRWDYVLDEMIFAFEMSYIEWEDHCYNDAKIDRERFEQTHQRIKKGFELFGKYFSSLWN